jgi:RNA polymerase sigma-70 factor (ECF subfamily)
MVRVSEGKTHDRQVSQDIVQVAFTDIWTNRETYGNDPEFKIESHLMTVIVRRSINSFKKNIFLTQKQLDLVALQLFHHNPIIENDIFAQELHDKLVLILSTFPERERECLTLRFFHSMGNEAIAFRLQLSIKTVEKHMKSAYIRLESFRSSF